MNWSCRTGEQGSSRQATTSLQGVLSRMCLVCESAQRAPVADNDFQGCTAKTIPAPHPQETESWAGGEGQLRETQDISDRPRKPYKCQQHKKAVGVCKRKGHHVLHSFPLTGSGSPEHSTDGFGTATLHLEPLLSHSVYSKW